MGNISTGKYTRCVGTLEVGLKMTRIDGSYNDATADNLMLVLTQ